MAIKNVRTTIYIEKELKDRLVERAQQEKRSFSNLVEILLEDAINRKEGSSIAHNDTWK